MSANNLSEWQQDFIDSYIENPPETALLVTGPGMETPFTSLKTWECLSSDYGYKNLIILTPAALVSSWEKLTQETLSYIPENIIINNVQKYQNTERLTSLTDSYHSSKAFIIVDEFHNIARTSIFKSIAADFTKQNNHDSKILSLSASRPETFKSALKDSLTIGRVYLYDEDILKTQQTKIEIVRFSPSYGILQKLLTQKQRIDDLNWREFEKLVAQLLESDGFKIELMNGTKDGGVDVIATKLLPVSGYYKTLWQAKKYSNNKVTISKIRELADSVNEFEATKGIIITTTFLTRGALYRVERDSYKLGKVDRIDLDNWINRILYK